MSKLRQMSNAAESMLRALRMGENCSDPRPYPGSFAYSHHARIFLNNAMRLCVDDGTSDFRVYGALYLFRHGVELLLKCLCRNDEIDQVLRVAMQPGLTFLDVCKELNLKKSEKESLRKSICVTRNLLQDNLRYPECWRKRISDAYADKALDFFREAPSIPRDRFTLTWASAPHGHDLETLWEPAVSIIESFSSNAKEHAFMIGYPAPMTNAELAPLVELLSTLDEGGDSFRYPSSTSGDWYTDTPKMSLNALGELIEWVESTCIVFQSVREEKYSLATFRNPSPQYSG